MEGLYRDDVSTAKHLKDLIISQMQYIYGPSYGHNIREFTDQPLNNVYTKFDVVPIQVYNVWHARGIVYLRSEQPSRTDINEHFRYKLLAYGRSEYDIIGALQGLWNMLQRATERGPLLQGLKVTQIYPEDPLRELELFKDWLSSFADVDRIFQ